METIRIKDKEYRVDMRYHKENVYRMAFPDGIPEGLDWSGGFIVMDGKLIVGHYEEYNTVYREAPEENAVYVSTGEVYVEPEVPDIPQFAPHEPTEEEIAAQKAAAERQAFYDGLPETLNNIENTLDEILTNVIPTMMQGV